MVRFITPISGCKRPSVIIPHASAMRGLVFPPDYLPVLCSQLLLEKVASNCLAAAGAMLGVGECCGPALLLLIVP